MPLAGCGTLRVAVLLVILATTARPAKAEVAVDLESSDFNSTLLALPADSWALVEFYASWCPACRAFMPDYEKVAVFFEGHPVDGKHVFVSRVDCA